jgi:alpha-beta hydrolase superfamily lysophospholipase
LVVGCGSSRPPTRTAADELKPLAASDKSPSYKSQESWKKIQSFLPKDMQLTDATLPKPATFSWRGHEVYTERFANPQSPVKFVLFHGVGTNGRQMTTLVGAPLARRGYETVSIDMPGYGVTRVNSDTTVVYDDWVTLGSEFVDAELKRDPRPVILYGLSAGGMLTYHVAAKNKKVSGIVGMTFLDQRVSEVRNETSRNWFMSNVGLPMAKMSSWSFFGGMKMPMTMVSKMSALVNDPKALDVFLDDRSSAGNSMPLRFLVDYTSYKPAIEPENFDVCPILLTQPAEDKWTPLRLSTPFLNRIKKVPVKVIMLDKAGHYPLEQPGIAQLHDAMTAFAKTVTTSTATAKAPSASTMRSVPTP